MNRDSQGRFKPAEKPLEALVAVEQVIVAPGWRRPHPTEAQEWGPCGPPPQMHRWWTIGWVSERIGDFTLTYRECVDCHYYVGVLA